jgi:V/A-type H+-transporting ATPase subunit K
MEQAIMALAAGLAISVTALATAMAQRAIGSAGVGAISEKPELIGSIIILVAIPETLVILGFAVAAIILLGGG